VFRDDFTNEIGWRGGTFFVFQAHKNAAGA
jgi:hypothetical protein